MKLKKFIIYLSIAINIIFVFVAFVALIWVNKNTSILNFNIDKQEIKENNAPSVDNNDYSTLISQQVNVPEIYKKGTFTQERSLNLPDSFQIEVFASGVETARGMDFDDFGNIYVTGREGKLYFLTDKDKVNGADEIKIIDSSLNSPHGIDYYKGDLYIGEQSQIVVYKNINENGEFSEKRVLIPNLPIGGHSTRTVKIGPDSKIYVSIGSSCNVCEESDSRRAAIVRYNLDGSGETIFASGLRNTVDFEFKLDEENLEYKIFGVDNGRDRIGDDIPPEEVNLIENGSNYGWPFCYGKKIANPEYNDKNQFCLDQTKDSYIDMQAHAAPLGIAFPNLEAENFPNSLLNNAFIGFHGSWNRTTPTGYKVVRVDVNDPSKSPVNFVTGWLLDSGDYWGRPVDTAFDFENNLYISDDYAGAIYKVMFKQ